MSLGLERAGFKVILGIDKDNHSIATHAAFFGGASIVEDLSHHQKVDQILAKLEGVSIAVVAGGPPCQPFSRAGKSKIRSLVETGARKEDDRRDLWKSFVRVVQKVKPQAVLIENVPDLALGSDGIVLRRIVAALEDLGYTVHTKILSASQFGVPQFRQRLILIGIDDSRPFAWPSPGRLTTSLRDAIDDLPAVPGGSSRQELPYDKPRSVYQRWCRIGVLHQHKDIIFDHITRTVREDDLEAFKLLDSKTRYNELPEHLRRYRSDIFTDKYNRLGWDDLSRTITAHLARDGYWYIHPEEHRTLSVREAARVQSFPDWFRFSGPPTRAYRQIGEAVPPLLAAALGRTLRTCLNTKTATLRVVTSSGLEGILRSWYATLESTNLSCPWRKAKNLWQALLGIIVFDHVPPSLRKHLWPTYANRWALPEAFLRDKKTDALLRAIGQSDTKVVLGAVAHYLLEKAVPTPSDLARLARISVESVNLALALSRHVEHRPPTVAAVRVAERTFMDDTRGSKMAGQLLLARLIGKDITAEAYVAVLEIGDKYCRPASPICNPCPLRSVCLTTAHQKRNRTLYE